MFFKLLSVFALVSAVLAAPKPEPKPEPQLLVYPAVDYTYPAVPLASPLSAFVSPYSAQFAYSPYSALPSAYSYYYR